MTDIIKTASFSAPKLSYFSKAEPKKTFFTSLSQESSPSLYCVLNFPVSDKPETNQKNYFFDNSVSLTELQMLGESSPFEPINQRFQESCEKAKSECKNFQVRPSFSPFKSLPKKKPQIFNFYNPISEVEEKEKKPKIELKLDLPCVKLQPPPLEKFKKRKERCTNLNESFSLQVHVGVVFRYSLKKRLGKIKFDEQKIVLFEDDLVVSGVNLRQFKNSVGRKENIRVQFKIKKYEENGNVKTRPFDIRIL
jgi:hypothetical protein